ncbi:MAG: SDR family NAD(P)-dependent oxidoreductase [Chloroflexi bacterium]|nr:SDR family NAD(P)-dependent oxidoreductase [Chloroflexota bacterium]
MLELADKAAIVTGGSKGIGKAIASAFLDAGAEVLIAARNEADLQATTAELAASGGRVESIRADVSQEADVKALFARAADLYDRVDILVNNAGFGSQPSLRKMETEVWEAVIATNLTGTFLCTREALRMMVPRRSGRIINIGSISSQRVRPNSAPYSASKFGLVGLTHSTALEGREFGISCGILHPGNVRVERRTRSERTRDEEPMMEPAELAQAALAMASLPAHVNMLETTVLPVGQLFIGRG